MEDEEGTQELSMERMLDRNLRGRRSRCSKDDRIPYRTPRDTSSTATDDFSTFEAYDGSFRWSFVQTRRGTWTGQVGLSTTTSVQQACAPTTARNQPRRVSDRRQDEAQVRT